MNRERIAVLVLTFLSPTALAAIPCEGRLNVLLDVWKMKHVGASSTISATQGNGKVAIAGHDKPSATQITMVYTKNATQNMKVVVDKSNCLMSSATIYVDGPNTLKNPVVLSRGVCRKIFQEQQRLPWDEDFDRFQENVMKSSVPGWAKLDEDQKHVYKGRILSNCGQTPQNAGAVKDRIGALGFLSYQEAALKTYFIKKDQKDEALTRARNGQAREGDQEILKDGRTGILNKLNGSEGAR
jgi:hypothetical protein